MLIIDDHTAHIPHAVADREWRASKPSILFQSLYCITMRTDEWVWKLRPEARGATPSANHFLRTPSFQIAQNPSEAEVRTDRVLSRVRQCADPNGDANEKGRRFFVVAGHVVTAEGH